VRLAVSLGGLFAVSGAFAAEPLAIYTDTLKPLLAERCFSCHGALKQEAGLRLDTVSLMRQGGDSGAAIAAGQADASLLLTRVAATDPAERMPPEGEGEPLTSEQVAQLAAWIAAGAPAPADEQPERSPADHWAFQPRMRPEVPAVANAGWVKNPIDAFLARAHHEQGLSPQPEASRATLVRRLHLDLIGLPPEPELIAETEAATATDWYEQLVERLLSDPRHGERWGRHWMDVWRYSDWWGLGEEHRNSQRHIWHWRDWIVESLNADLPYDEMLRQMLAADELYPDDPAKLRATGYLARNFFVYNRHQWLDETVEHVGKGLLGLTMNCSKCHDHKYDPIPQADYYKLRAFFEPYHVRLDLVPGEADLGRDGIPRVFDGLTDAPTYLFVRGEESRPDRSRSIPPGVPDFVAFRPLSITPVSLPKVASEPERQPWVAESHLASARRAVAAAEEALAKVEAGNDTTVTEAKRAVARASCTSLERRIDAARARWEWEELNTGGDQPPLVRGLARSAVRAERELAVAKARQKLAEVEGRRRATETDPKGAIAAELTAARGELESALAAVDAPGEAFTPLVGAAWVQTHFNGAKGKDPVVAFPAVSTGRRRALAEWITDPRHPLTSRVAVNHIWLRHMGQPLVTTMFDFGRKGNAPIHPQLLDWLASELVDSGWSMKHLHRLIVTSAAYRMASSPVGGDATAARDPDNRFLWRREGIRLESQAVRDCMLSIAGTLDSTMGGPPVPAAEQAASRRRSLYFFHSNIDRNRFLTAFDEADVKECYRRDQSIVPQQALALSNAALVHDAAAAIADRLDGASAGAASTAPPPDDSAFTASAFVAILGRRPTAAETAVCLESLAAWRGQGPAAGTPAPAGDHSRTQLVWSLLNHTEFLTIR
jgi:hypothetical protein